MTAITEKDEAKTFCEMWAESENIEPVEPIVVKKGKRGVMPVCPRCGEMAYSWKRCIYCGQVFIEHKRGRK